MKLDGNQFIVFVLLLLLCNCKLQANYIKGVIIDYESQKPIPNVTIQNIRSEKGTISNIYGQFQLSATSGDSIKFSSVGYQSQFKVVQNSDTLFVKLKSTSYYLDAFNLIGNDRIPPECRSDVFPNGKPGILGALGSPVSYCYYLFSRRERAKRRFLKRFEEQKRMARVMTVYNRELIMDFTGLSGSALDSCIIYCNMHIQLEENDTEFIVKHKLLEVLTDYARLKRVEVE